METSPCHGACAVPVVTVVSAGPTIMLSVEGLADSLADGLRLSRTDPPLVPVGQSGGPSTAAVQVIPLASDGAGTFSATPGNLVGGEQLVVELTLQAAFLFPFAPSSDGRAFSLVDGSPIGNTVTVGAFEFGAQLALGHMYA